MNNNIQLLLLKFSMEHDMLSSTDTLEDAMKKSRLELLQLHNHSIYQRSSDGRWTTKLGKHKPYTRLVRVNRTDLEDALIEYYLSITKGNINFEACLNEWLKSEEQSSNPSISPKSVTNYRAEYNRFIKGHTFCNKRMLDIRERDIHDLLTDIVERPEKIARKRFNSLKSLITNVFNYARMDLKLEVILVKHIMKELVFKPNQFLVSTQKQQVFYQDDMQTLLNYLLQENTLISLGIALTAQTGLRVSEISALSWEDVFDDYLHICRAEHSWTSSDGTRHVELGLPKEYKTRNVILSDEARTIISMIRLIHPTQKDFVFLNNGQRATCRMFDYYVRKYCKACDIPILSMHKLRKTYASVLLARGYADKVVQSQLGHSDISTTQQHYNFNPYMVREQVNLFKDANVLINASDTKNN